VSSRQAQNWGGRYYVCGNNTYYCRNPQSTCYWNGHQYRCTHDGSYYMNNHHGGGHQGWDPHGGGHQGWDPHGGGHQGWDPHGGGHQGWDPHGGGHQGWDPHGGPQHGFNGWDPHSPHGNPHGGWDPHGHHNGWHGNGLHYGGQSGRYYVCPSPTHYCRNPASTCYWSNGRYWCSRDGNYGTYNYRPHGYRWSYNAKKGEVVKPPAKSAKPDVKGMLSFPTCDGDWDCDGVTDDRDNCSLTLPRSADKSVILEHVWKDGKWAGCSEGQIRDIGDADRDNVPDSVDACPDTTPHTLVSIQQGVAGCAAAQHKDVQKETSQTAAPGASEDPTATIDAQKSGPVSLF
jgi:hypothetical protein